MDSEEGTYEIPGDEILIHESVGTGNTAEVFRGFYTKVSKEVAVKVMNKGSFGAKEQLAFAREIGVLTKVIHEKLVIFYGISYDGDVPRLITEYCDGGAVFDFLHNNPDDDYELSPHQEYKMSVDVALAMNYLHNFDPMIVHRDLKSLNLLLHEQISSVDDVPLVKVCDFGVSKLKESGDWGKMTALAGTKHWMAPEMWITDSYNEKVDVYSYAMVLFEILCREVPFEDEEPADVGKLTAAGERPDMEAVPPDADPTLLRVMEQCWAQDPKARPSFKAVLEELEAGR
eukprot:TRINITY_DN41797_c0_g1_i1.p1 TRINITY_DN41797_c0_g1~~TRINITY_DN41797_c0_g1_i1.p1  ORF type:complete len:287 (-),score=54.55 TRINITY_DN41797_c0_g1_i1:58-918(-)